jgi:hypothetical protein
MRENNNKHLSNSNAKLGSQRTQLAHAALAHDIANGRQARVNSRRLIARRAAASRRHSAAPSRVLGSRRSSRRLARPRIAPPIGRAPLVLGLALLQF